MPRFRVIVRDRYGFTEELAVFWSREEAERFASAVREDVARAGAELEIVEER